MPTTMIITSATGGLDSSSSPSSSVPPVEAGSVDGRGSGAEGATGPESPADLGGGVFNMVSYVMSIWSALEAHGAKAT